MKADILLGLQWGDEGKGKIVDVLAPKYDIVARFQGGPNAGHTLEFDGRKHVLRSIPSGVFGTGSGVNVIGNGVVLDPVLFRDEAADLEAEGVDLHSILRISKKAHLILPTHRLLDAAGERAKGASKIGTTGKGIGPTYTDKISRRGLRVGDTIEADFLNRYEALRNQHIAALKDAGAELPANFEELEKTWLDAIDYLRGYRLTDTEHFVNKALADNKSLLCEGAQGTMLDIDFGSYPFVTSSNTVAAGACTGLGLAPGRIGKVYGIFKAYCTRVGSGPFPTELFDETGAEIRRIGHEFGAVTGRERRCGWLDLVALRYRPDNDEKRRTRRIRHYQGSHRIPPARRHHHSRLPLLYRRQCRRRRMHDPRIRGIPRLEDLPCRQTHLRRTARDIQKLRGIYRERSRCARNRYLSGSRPHRNHIPLIYRVAQAKLVSFINRL